MSQATIIRTAFAFILGFSLVGCSPDSEKPQLSADQEKEISERLAPVGEVEIQGQAVANVEVSKETSTESSRESGIAAGRSPEAIYNKACVSCHATGAAGAPKMGVAADWKDRLAKGVETLHSHAISGLNAMPPRGLCMDCTDDELKATVDYMIEKSR